MSDFVVENNLSNEEVQETKASEQVEEVKEIEETQEHVGHEEPLESEAVSDSVETQEADSQSQVADVQTENEEVQETEAESSKSSNLSEETPTMTTMEDALDSVREIKVGDTVVADVLAFDENNQVRVAIHESGGLEGVVPRNELSNSRVEDPSEVVSIGDEMELVVIKPIKDKENGNFLLSKKRVDAKKVWEELQRKFENKEIIEAPVKSVVKGGLVVDAGVRGFVPASMVEDHFVEDFSQYVDKTLQFMIVEIEPSENRLILSHKEIARQNRENKRQERLTELKEGDIIEGKVARLVNFGAFIDLGGVDGLVHISRIAHEHVNKPSDYLTPGDVVKVKVLSVDEGEGRVSLSIKDTLPGAWDNIEEKAPEGSVLSGVVKRLTTFGAFVEVFPSVEGLVHISQISHEHIATPHEKLQEGQDIQVKVLSVHPEEQRLSLSIKALEDAPAKVETAEGHEENAPKAPQTNKPRRQNKKPQQPVVEDNAESSFTMGELLGDAFSSLNLTEEE